MSNDRFWDQMLPLLQEGRVIPVVGRDLLTLEVDGLRAGLYEHLARRLSQRLGLVGDVPRTLNDVACRYMTEIRQPLEDIYPALKRELTLLEAGAPPLPLQQLAEIDWFKLYVSTTFDDFLYRAVDGSARYGDEDKGKRLTTGLAYGLMNNYKDLPDKLDDLQRPVVYQLLGRASAVQDTYAVTDEDLLEFVHVLQIESRRPKQLFEALENRHLLLIGSGFSPWLVRFFLRAVKHRDRLWQVRGRASFMVDAAARDDTAFVEFLRHYSDRTMVYESGTAEGFVDELWTRWKCWKSQQPAEATAVASTPRPDGTPRHAVFISYASEDRAVAERIKSQLDKAGIDAWFDRNELQAGQLWAREIEKNIDAAAVFVPLLSASVLQPGAREFRAEWEHALKARDRRPREAKDVPARFILPVMIDGNIAMEAHGIHAYFGDIQGSQFPGGQLSPEFCDLLCELVRAAQLGR